jgi:hypothetical protein
MILSFEKKNVVNILNKNSTLRVHKNEWLRLVAWVRIDNDKTPDGPRPAIYL